MEIGREAFEQAIEAGGENMSRDDKQFYLGAYDALVVGMGFDEPGEAAS